MTHNVKTTPGLKVGLGVIAAGLLAGTASVPALAAGDSHLYIGGSYGLYKDRNGDFDEDDNFKEIFVGAQFNPVLGLEASYLEFGEFSGALGSSDIDGYDLALVARLPLTESFSIYAKGGQLFWDADIRVAGFKDSADGDDPFVGVGADFAITDNLVVALEYDRYRIDIEDNQFPGTGSQDWDGDMDTMKIGARLLF